LRDAEDLRNETTEVRNTIIQVYADDMILISNSKENLQILISRAKSTIDFADIIFNPNKGEVMAINQIRNEEKFKISNVTKEYIASNNFIKYLGVPIGSRKISETKLLETKVQKVLEE
jgi:hypothetical protein